MTKNHMNNYRDHLTIISNGLEEMARAAGRTDYTINQLLRECYNLIDAELKPKEEWVKEGRDIRQGQHAYLFWNKDYIDLDKRKVIFLFCKEQTIESTKE